MKWLTWGHTARWGGGGRRGAENNRGCMPGVLLLFGSRVEEPRVLWAHSLLVNLKQKSMNLKCGKRKN